MKIYKSDAMHPDMSPALRLSFTWPYSHSWKHASFDPAREVVESRTPRQLKTRLLVWMAYRQQVRKSAQSAINQTASFMGMILMNWSHITPWYTLFLFYASLVLAAFITGVWEGSLLNDMRRSYLDAFSQSPDSDRTPEEGYESELDSAKTMRALSFAVELQDQRTLDPEKLIPADKVLERVQSSKPSRPMMRKWQRSVMLLGCSWVVIAGGLALHILVASSWRKLEIGGLGLAYTFSVPWIGIFLFSPLSPFFRIWLVSSQKPAEPLDRSILYNLAIGPDFEAFYRREYHPNAPVDAEQARAPEAPDTSRFPCSLEGCRASFSRREFLEKHMWFIHGQSAMFRCSVTGCDRRGSNDFKTREESVKHFLEAHRRSRKSRSLPKSEPVAARATPTRLQNQGLEDQGSTFFDTPKTFR